jgi:hypothetical protein
MSMYRSDGMVVKYEWWCENRIREVKKHKSKRNERRQSWFTRAELLLEVIILL